MALKNVWGPSDKESEVRFLVQKLTSTGKKTLEDCEMKKLKNICKLSDKYVSCAFYALMTQLRKDHAEIRYSALLVINELFLRSSVFRAKLEYDFEEFLELVEGTDPDKPLPLPVPVAKELKLKGLEFIKNWATKFGEKYIRLQLAVNYLKNCRKVDFNDLEARNVVERERQRQEQERLDRVNNKKISRVKEEMREITEEMCGVSTQMENCFKLLIPNSSDHLFTADDFVANLSGNEDASRYHDTKSCDSSSKKSPSISNEDRLRHHGITDMKKNLIIEVQNSSGITVDINYDTSPVIDNLKDLEKQITSRYYPSVIRWLKILSKGRDCSDALKKAIDIKQLLESSLKKYKELKLKPSTIIQGSDDEDDFEEVAEKEGYEAMVQVPKAPTMPSKVAKRSQASTSKSDDSFLWKLEPKEDADDPTSAASTLKKRFESIQPGSISPLADNSEGVSPSKKGKNDSKAELLEKAPVLPYDIDLYHWEEEKPLVPERIKFDSLHKFWECKDESEESEALKEEQVASLRTRKIDFSGKFEPVKWTCRAPLASGKLCPRKDRYKCPFHGRIIPRDVLGNPNGDPASIPGPSKMSSSSETPDWQDPALLRDIEAATGIDLKVPDKKSKKGGRKSKDGLTNIKKINDTARNRLTKKIMKRYQHYAPKLDEMERKRFNDKFGDQWNYY